MRVLIGACYYRPSNHCKIWEGISRSLQILTQADAVMTLLQRRWTAEKQTDCTSGILRPTA